MPHSSATRRVTPSDMWVLRLSQTTSHRAAGAAEVNEIVQERHEIGLGAGITDSAADFACGNIERGDQGFGAASCRIYSNSRRSTCPGFIGRLGAARSSAWIPVISSIDTVCTPCSAAVGAAW